MVTRDLVFRLAAVASFIPGPGVLFLVVFERWLGFPVRHLVWGLTALFPVSILVWAATWRKPYRSFRLPAHLQINFRPLSFSIAKGIQAHHAAWLGTLFILLFTNGFALTIESSDSYRTAIEALSNNEDITNRIGVISDTGYLVSGSFSTGESRRVYETAEMSILLFGERGVLRLDVYVVCELKGICRVESYAAKR